MFEIIAIIVIFGGGFYIGSSVREFINDWRNKKEGVASVPWVLGEWNTKKIHGTAKSVKRRKSSDIAQRVQDIKERIQSH
jgi:hypothetical protein